MIKLGKIYCDVCGRLIFDLTMSEFQVRGITRRLHAHDGCVDKAKNCYKDWQSLPDGPLRKAFAIVHEQKKIEFDPEGFRNRNKEDV